MNATQVKDVIEKIDRVLEGKSISKKVKQKLQYAKKNWPASMDRYKQHEKILGNRNSYSKTDTDATFVRMEEDHMRNGQLKPAYNVQLSSHNQYIANYNLYQNSTDTTTLKKHIDSFNALDKHYPQVIVADAGYGSEENYQLLANRNIEGYIKHNQFDRSKRSKNFDAFKSDNLVYVKQHDVLICPSGKSMKSIGKTYRTTANGFKQKMIKISSH